jgi:F0F1-type ATP synthase epsilon subunit
MVKHQEASTGEMVDDGQSSSASGQPTMHIKVYSPFKTYFDETGASISAENATGPFDILPKHHNFITLLEPCDLVIGLAGKNAASQTIHISGGIMHVKADEVTVFLDV